MSVYQMDFIVNICWDFPGGSEVKNPLASAGDTSLIPDPGRFHWPQSNEALRHSYGAHALEPVPLYERSHCSDKPVPCN